MSLAAVRPISGMHWYSGAHVGPQAIRARGGLRYRLPRGCVLPWTRCTWADVWVASCSRRNFASNESPARRNPRARQEFGQFSGHPYPSATHVDTGSVRARPDLTVGRQPAGTAGRTGLRILPSARQSGTTTPYHHRDRSTLSRRRDGNDAVIRVLHSHSSIHEVARAHLAAIAATLHPDRAYFHDDFCHRADRQAVATAESAARPPGLSSYSSSHCHFRWASRSPPVPR